MKFSGTRPDHHRGHRPDRHGPDRHGRGGGYYHKNCDELQRLQDEAYDEFKEYAALFENAGLGNLDDVCILYTKKHK